jgi:flavin reductase (DIM6/NTAB) family NADH-FMN oxidoreductase RutF
MLKTLTFKERPERGQRSLSLGDRAGTNPAATAGIFALQAVALVALIAFAGRDPLWLMLFVVPFGAASGAMTLSRAALLAKLYGPAHYGGISGVSNTFMTSAMVLAPVGAGVAYGVAGDYEAVFLALAVGSALAAIAMAVALRAAAPSDRQPLERKTTRTRVTDGAVGDALRAATRKSASPVAVVTAKGGEESRGITVSSLTSVSLDPALISFAIRKRSRMEAALATADRFHVRLLGEGQARLAARFAATGLTGREQFEGLTSDPDGEPRLPGALATLTCVPYARIGAGDHLVVLGMVVEVESGDDGGPLLFHNRSYRRVGESADESRRDPRTA